MAGFTPFAKQPGGDDGEDRGFQPLREIYVTPEPQRNALAAGLSSGVDQLQGLGYSTLGGIADGLGANGIRDYANEQARRNAIDGGLSGRPDLERVEDQTLGSALPYAGYQIAKQVPLMAALMGAQAIPGVGQAAGALGLSRLGAIAPRLIGGGGLEAGASLAARRTALAQGESFGSQALMGTALGYGSLYGESVEGGNPSPYAAALLAPFYGVAEAAVPAAVRGALRAPSQLAGNRALRMVKAGGLGLSGEAGTELFQNELEMGINGSVTPEEAFSRRLNSAVAGGLVGGALGSAGGIRGPRTVDQGPTNLLGETDPQTVPPAPPQPPPQLGYDRNPRLGQMTVFPDGSASTNEEQTFERRFLPQPGAQAAPAAPQVPGANMENDAAVAQTLQAQQEQIAQQAEAAKAQQDAQDRYLVRTAQMLGVTPVADLKEGAAFDVLGTRVYSQMAVKILVTKMADLSQQLSPDQQQLQAAVLGSGLVKFVNNTGGLTTEKIIGAVDKQLKGMQLDGIGSLASAAEIVNDQIATRVAAGKTEAEPKLGQMAVFYEKLTGQRPPALDSKETVNVSDPSVFAAGDAPGGAGPSPVVNGSVGAAGPVPAVPGRVRGDTGNTGAANQPVSVVADGAAQPPTAVKTKPVKAAPAPAPAPAEPVEAQVAAIETEAQTLADEVRQKLLKVFTERDLSIMVDALVNNVTRETLANTHGISTGRISQIVSPVEIDKKFVAAEKKSGLSKEQLRGLLSQLMAQSSQVEALTNNGETDRKLSIADLGDTAQASLSEAGFSTVETAGGSTSNYKDSAAAGGKTQTRQATAQLVELRDALANAESIGDDGRATELTGKIDDLQSQFVSAGDQAGAFTQAFSDLLDKAEALEAAIKVAEAAGSEKIPGKDKKLTLTEAKAKAEGFRVQAAHQLSLATKKLEQNAGGTAPTAAAPKRELPADLATAKAKLKSAKGDVAQMASEELKLLRTEAMRFNNTALVSKIDAQLESPAAPNSVAAKPASTELAVVTSKGPAPAPKPDAPKAPEPTPRQDSGQVLWESLRQQAPNLAPYEDLSPTERGYLTELADRTKGKPEVAKELGLQELMANGPSQPTQSVDEPLRQQVKNLSKPQIKKLERYYDEDQDSPAFLTRLRKDIALFSTQGENGVAGGIRESIRPLARTPSESNPVFSSASATAQSSQKTAPGVLEKLAQAVSASLPGAPPIVVMGVPSDAFGGRVPAGFAASGATNGKTIFLFRNFIGSELDGLRAIFHELFHVGLSKVLPQDQYIQTMLKLLNKDSKVRQYAARWRASEDGQSRKADMPANNWQALSVEEALADIAEDISTGAQVGSALTGVMKNIAAWAADVAQLLRMPTLARSIRRMTLNETERFVADMVQASALNTPSKLADKRFSTSAATRSAVPKSVRPQVTMLTQVLKAVKDGALNTVVFSEDLFRRAADMGLKSAQDMNRIYRERSALTGNIEREVTRVENLFQRIPKAYQGTGPQSANRFLYDSTRTRTWGAAPTWRDAKAPPVKVDPAMAKRYQALPKEARVWVDAVLEHGDKLLALKKNTLLESTTSEYDALIAGARAAGDTDKVDGLTKDKIASLKQFTRLFTINEFMPYAPMRRFGNWVVVARSKAYDAALASGDAAQISKLESDPDHYHVSFAESLASALELQRELKAEGHFTSLPEPKRKEDTNLSLYGGLMSAFTKLRGNIESELNGATDPKEIAALKAARQTVVEMYLQSLSENSARKSEMRRRGVAGEIDMLRSFSTQGRADAHFLAAAKYNPQAQQAVVKMRQEKNQPGDETAKSMAFNEVMARHEQSMKFEEGGWFGAANAAARVSSVWLLATNPMYYLQNLTQPFVLSLPFMAGKHDYNAASGQLVRAYFQLGALLKSAKAGEGFDFSQVSKDKKEQEMVLTLVDRGRIDIGMDTELGRVKLDGNSAASKALNQGDQWLRSLSQKVEAINRVSTALAAYRLERAAGSTPEQALEYADSVISQTHGDYTRINAPRAFNTPAGKVALQFRKFQLIQLTLLSKLVYNSVKGGTAAEKTAARRALTFTLAHTGVLAGVVGMPGFAAAAFVIGKLADAFGDDDAPYNLENELRKLLGNSDAARLVMRGAPTLAGTDLSGKLGMGTALSILPFTDFEASREGFNAIATGLTLGATGGLGAKVFEGLGQIKDGDYYNGLTKLAPVGVANAMKAFTESQGGVTRKNGDVLVKPDEIATWESFAKAIGWPTAADSERRFDTNVAFDDKGAFQDKANSLKTQYTKARRDGDSEAATKAIEAWQRLQTSRRNAGFAAQPLSSLMKAPQEQAKRERNTTGGLQFDKRNRQFVQEQTQ